MTKGDNRMHPHALFSRARRHGWEIEADRSSSEIVVTLRRDVWRLEVVFSGRAPRYATITGPGFSEGPSVNLRAINGLVRCDPGRIGVVAEAAVAGRAPAREEVGHTGTEP
ncbi:hypothetical protein [Nonomuraea aridisoli]|uniref:Uncharacterized protein n=1 Tax=Nonomuraea aridisoli TaxID=2070368 RepID=A0A2W2EJD9_9ACTN|nr:hypothetical protein [Nonomuraea aridisoli]PZG22771.1 hypothetical protein C1J01_02725 [Nonomuraea aridisoli]